MTDFDPCPCIAGYFPDLPATPKPLGGHVPRRRDISDRQVPRGFGGRSSCGIIGCPNNAVPYSKPARCIVHDRGLK